MPNVLATLDHHPLLLAQPDVTDQDQSASQEEDGSADGGGNGNGGGGGFFSDPMFMIVLVGMMVLWIFLLGSGSRKQKKKQQQLLASMTKGSKVVTIGGIKGSVVEIRDEEVVVKVDENNNTRMKFSRDAIRTVLDDSAAKDGDAKDGKESKDTKDDKDAKKD